MSLISAKTFQLCARRLTFGRFPSRGGRASQSRSLTLCQNVKGFSKSSTNTEIGILSSRQPFSATLAMSARNRVHSTQPDLCRFSTCAILRKEPAVTKAQAGAEASNIPHARDDMGHNHNLSNLDKKVLVWTKMYASEAEVPEAVSKATMSKARDMMRIRVNIGMILATLVACAAMIVSGKRAARSGDSLDKRGKEQIEKARAKGLEEEKARQAAAKN